MPKEVIRAASFPYGEENGARSVAEIRWDRDAGHVQLATRCLGIDGGVYVPDWIGDPLVAAGFVHSGRTWSSDERGLLVTLAQDGWFIDLDRYGLNTMIRNMRRARDQAFGRDE